MLETAEILKFLATFSIITIFIYSIYYYINKSGFKLTAKGGKNIEILEARYFSKNRGLILAKVQDTIFFLSMDEKGIKKLKEWKSNESIKLKANGSKLEERSKNSNNGVIDD